MADIIQDHDIQLPDALDIFGTRFIRMGIKSGVDQRHQPGAIPHDIGHKAVVGMQGDANTQTSRLHRQGQKHQQAQQEATTTMQDKGHGRFPSGFPEQQQ